VSLAEIDVCVALLIDRSSEQRTHQCLAATSVKASFLLQQAVAQLSSHRAPLLT
jgi:hypothetical protein